MDSAVDIGPYSFEEFCERATRFHGYPARGLLIGGYMVDAAWGRLPEGTRFEALVETPKWLPEAVQLLTPCTIGNRRLRLIVWGLYALNLFDKYTGMGFRAFLDPARLEPWPEIRSWHLKLKPKHLQNTDALFREIRRAGPMIPGISLVQISRNLVQMQ